MNNYEVCGFCARAGAPHGVNGFEMQVGDRLLKAEGTIRPDPDGPGHLFEGLTVDDPANREQVTVTLEQPHWSRS